MGTNSLLLYICEYNYIKILSLHTSAFAYSICKDESVEDWWFLETQSAICWTVCKAKGKTADLVLPLYFWSSAYRSAEHAKRYQQPSKQFNIYASTLTLWNTIYTRILYT